MKNIIIVESPSKSKTIESYMGSEYKVVSSLGHIRDLATSGKDGLGIDVENDFKPNYTTIKGKQALVKELTKIVKGNKVFLATDPDREGEAISYHLASILNLDLNDFNRIEFHEVTKPAIMEAFNHPRKIDMDLVASQETRRMVDRIIGFKLSKLLQSKIKSKSAGRVQSVALKLICDLEEEIQAFVSTPYYELEALLDSHKISFVSYKGSKQTIVDKALADEIYNSLAKHFLVSGIETKENKRESKLAYTTSTLQQDASNKLHFTSSRTMSVAQGLYEGKDIGNEKVGLITYMRTDSTHLSDVFVNEATSFISNNYGTKYLGKRKEKAQKLAQEAHEAIRPTSVHRSPESISKYLSADEYKLYKMIYNRTLSSLMSPAIFQATKISFTNNDTTWKMNGQKLLFDGYLLVYGKDEDDMNNLLPDLAINQVVTPNEISLKELFTKPKARYTEATLIKDMEELGIGRPSTYAQTMLTLNERLYTQIEDRKIIPTKQGMLTSKALGEYFEPIINVKYTAQMEDTLDKISKGEAHELDELKRFYSDFMPLFDYAKENMIALPPRETGELCPKCGSPLVIRTGRYGEFTACSNFPECKYIKADEEIDDSIDTQIECPKCHKGHLIKKIAKKGKNKGKEFYACNNFPACKTIYNDLPTTQTCPNCGSIMLQTDGGLVCSMHCEDGEQKPQKELILCPKCHKGHLVRRVAKKGSNAGKSFYACDNYPRCKTMYNGEPTNEVCPKCGSLMIIVDDKIKCSNENCE